jgi:soluble lytic murein transglycosylase-like protein/TolA-binding protein
MRYILRMRHVGSLLTLLLLVVPLALATGGTGGSEGSPPAASEVPVPGAASAAPASAAHVTDWRAANAAGDCGSVLRLLPSPGTPVERLAAARCHARAGAGGRALEVLGEGVAWGEVAPYAALVRAQALLARDRPADAAKALDGVDLPGDEHRLLRARALVLADRGLEARDTLRALLDGSFGAEARYWLAYAAERRGDAAAVGTYQVLWKKHPTSEWARKAEDRLRGLQHTVPDLESADGRALALDRAKELWRLRQAQLAVPLLDSIHTRQPFTSTEDQLRMADALAGARLHARALEWYARAGAERLSADTAFAQALATARAGDYAQAAALYTDLAKRFPGTPQADEAAWKLPWMDYDAGKLLDAEAGMGRYLDARPDGRFVNEARWFRAWSSVRRGDTPTALQRLEEVQRRQPGTDTAIAARYWHARLREDDVALRAVLADHPDSGYAYFVAERLGVRFPARAEVAPADVPADWVRARPALGVALRLVDAGFVEWARPLLARHASAAKDQSADVRIGMAWALHRAEDYKGGKSLAAGLCGTSSTAQAACTPRPHGAIVRAVADSLGLPALLPYAIMTAESGLDPAVTSPVGARGLMQLMPELALKLAQDDLPGFVVDDLYLAGANARLGTKELGLLHRTFRERTVAPVLPLVIAGYNGGSSSVERWLGAYPTAPGGDRFTEDIGYTETRRYVKRVLGYYMQYRRVYGDG